MMSKNIYLLNLFPLWWKTLSESEKKTVVSGCILGFFLLYFFLIHYPIINKINELHQKIIIDKEQIIFMTHQINDLKEESSATQNINNPASLLTLIDNVSKSLKWGDSITELKLIDTTHAELSANNISFDLLIIGLEKLWNQNKILVEKISVKRINTSNLVQAQIVLKI
jgi:type II secretory pathway component PulM